LTAIAAAFALALVVNGAFFAAGLSQHRGGLVLSQWS
jgi:hypothetical protein